MNINRIIGSVFITSMLLIAGCGKPQSQGGGPPPGAPAMAVVAKVVEQAIEDKLELVASIQAKEEITVVSEIAARVTAITFSEGERIKAGQIFFRLDDVSTTANMKEAEARFKLAEISYKRNQDLFESQTVPQQLLDQAEAEYHSKTALLALARDSQAKTEIKAPFNGVAGECLVSIGQYVRVGDELTRLQSIDPIELVFNVPERYLGRLKQKQVINFTTVAFPNEVFSGNIAYISPSLETATRTVRVKAEITNSDGRLKPGMFGRLSLVFSVNQSGLLIPESAVQFMGEATIVVTVNEAGVSAFVPVQLGRRFSKQVEVLGGLEAGTLVVAEGHQKMGPGMNVIATADSAAYGVTPGPLFKQESTPDKSSETTIDESKQEVPATEKEGV
jgi:membrane fusion protein (multidrug efflux system)